jgi:hypothetical protein
MYGSSGFLDIGSGFYKEKGKGAFAGDDAIIGSASCGSSPVYATGFSGRTACSDHCGSPPTRLLKDKNPVPTSFIRAAAVMDIPLLFKETNAEAIRTLVFMERKKRTEEGQCRQKH